MGAVELRGFLPESDPDQDCPPGGVLPPQGQRGVADLIRISMRQARGLVVVGRHAVRSSVAESFSQMPYGARGEAKGGREAGGRLPLVSALEQLSPHGDGHRLWHRGILRPRGGTLELVFH